MAYYRDIDFIVAFGKQVQNIRKQKNITQEQLADYADIDLTQIGRIERGVTNTSISIVNKLAKALDVHPSELFNF